ncbi:type II secretion system minor pseudopilin GspH [Parasphingorhabdus sp. JC815]|uniref:type II secretion system minor pseudopilin GspH n=1 Tax=Parasphingorhabdus sp. JC815 TaxID=3232140 RepID=UPI00345971F1
MERCRKLRQGANRATYDAGFTLVELMIVLVILGLMASVAVMSFPEGNDLQRDAQRFAARTAALRDNAILQSRPMAVQVTPSGYVFLERRKGGWRVIDDKPFHAASWSSGVSAAVDEGGSMLISFESTGLPSDQAELRLSYEDLSRSIMITPMGDVELVAVEAAP